jgi:mannose-6-phosphate isomerase
MAVLLEGRIQRYLWGSTTLIQELCGWAGDGQPIAELWFGAHPKAPSRVHGTNTDLLQLLQPGHGLTFLLKLIAVAQPLSIQAHPNTEAAKAGHQREVALGMELSAPERSYPDPNHKPELLVALSQFHALAGFDTPERIREAMAVIQSANLQLLISTLKSTADLQRSFSALLQSDPGNQSQMLGALRSADTKGNSKLALAQELLTQYPNDLGALLSIFLRKLVLQPGQALYVTSGLLHCYLSGLAVEVMANSDNVLRCGLTSKHVNVPELLRVVDANAAPLVLEGKPSPGSQDTPYPVPVPEFRLSRLTVSTQPLVLDAQHAEIVLAVSSAITVVDGEGTTVVQPGQAAFVPKGMRYTVQGSGACFRACAGAPGATIRPVAMSQ